jgi:acetolactate synthase-1/2/3 large subunit
MDKIKQAIDLMAHAKRPLFYTGGGVVNSGKAACDLLREFVKLTGYPITSTLMGLGAFPAADPKWIGMLGMHWNARSQHGDARLRRDDLCRCAL